MRNPDPRIKPPLGSYINLGYPPSSQLVGCYMINEGSGSFVKDYCQNNHLNKIGSGEIIGEGFKNLASYSYLEGTTNRWNVSNFSLIIGFKPIQIDSGDGFLFYHRYELTNSRIYCGTTGNDLWWRIGGNSSRTVSYGFSVGQKITIALTINQDVARFYINGILKDTQTFSPFSSVASTFKLGGSSANADTRAITLWSLIFSEHLHSEFINYASKNFSIFLAWPSHTTIFDLGASGGGAVTQTVDLDALLQGALDKTTSLDALLQATLPVTISLDGLIEAVNTISTSLNGIVQGELTKFTSIDALIQGVQTGTVSVDALLQQIGVTTTLSIDAILTNAPYKTTSLDALLQESGVIATVSLDAILESATNPTKDITLNALLSGSIIKTLSFDALLQASQNKTLNLDAQLAYLQTISTTIDGILQGEISKNTELDALLTKLNNTKILSLDALLASGQIKQVSLDAIIAYALSKQVNFDALLQGQQSKSLLIDAIIYSTLATAPPRYTFTLTVNKPSFTLTTTKPSFAV